MGLDAALVAAGYDVVWLDLSETEEWEVRSEHPLPASLLGRRARSSWHESLASLLLGFGVELALPAVHGPIGQDGRLHALCESLALPYVGCSRSATVDCYDKLRCKRMLQAAGLPVAHGVSVERAAYERDVPVVVAAVERELGYPCIVKPARGGSSLGLARVERRDELAAAIAQAFAFDDLVLVEELFPGADVEIGVLEADAMVVGTPVELDYEGTLYDFEIKCAGDRDVRYLPARLSADLLDRATAAAGEAFTATGCSGLARVDLLVDPASDRFVVNEINTIPHMPASSTFASSLCHRTGETYGNLLTWIVQAALAQPRGERAVAAATRSQPARIAASQAS